MTWLGVAVAVFILLSIFMGYRKGFVKEIVSLIFMIITMIIVWTISPYVSQFLKEQTPVYSIVKENCQETISEQLTADKGTKEDQESIIEGLPLPETLKKSMSANNNAEVYQYLAVNTFVEYIADYLAVIITNGIGFALSYLLAAIIMKILMHILDIMTHLPVINGANHLAGSAIGFVKSVLIIWIAFLVITIFLQTDWGSACMRAIESDRFLSVLYDSDILIHVFMSIFYGN